jgi:hypothetical protein
VPQDDNDTADPLDALVPLPDELAPAAEVDDDEPPAALELELELLPHPANARTPITAARAAVNRLRDAQTRIRTFAPLH